MAREKGSRLGPYEILGLVGSGGMGEVYAARDPRLARTVALKLLPQAALGSADRLRMFQQEARAAGALSDPNILAVYDVGVDDGVPYIVSELLEGESLRGRLGSGPLPARKAVEIAAQVASGLAAAHATGIVHRDLKPENLFITENGRVKILDFGLAKLAAADGPAGRVEDTATVSLSGTVAGTAGYMSPEQARGQSVDQRSDIFSLGAILYEMLSGRRAFVADSIVEILNATLTEDPPSLAAGRRPLLPGLERIVMRCLEKRAAERFQSARDLGFALEALLGASAEQPVTTPQAETAFRSVAVLPFRDLNRRPENADFGLGLADATITELSLVRSLLVRPTSSILQYQDRVIDPQGAARELSVDAVLDGSFQRSGDRIRVTVRLVSGDDGRALWASKIDALVEDIFRMQDDVSRRIAAALDVQLSPTDERRLTEGVRSAPAGEAYHIYVAGKSHLYRGTIAEANAAIECFERARAADPGFALAWAGLGDAYARMAFEYAPDGDWYSRAREMCDKALSLEPGLPEGRYLRGRLSWNPQAGFDHAQAMREAAGALALRPGLNEARYLLGLVLLHVGLIEESEREFDRVLAVDPQDAYARMHRGMIRLHQGRIEEALELATAAAHAFPAPWSWSTLAQCQIRLGRLVEAAHTVERMGRETPNFSEVHALSGLVAALGGDRTRAEQGIERTARSPRAFGHYHHAQYDIACIHAQLGDSQHALDWLGQAIRNGYPCHRFISTDSLLEPLHDHEGFIQLMQNLRAECDGYRTLHANL